MTKQTASSGTPNAIANKIASGEVLPSDVIEFTNVTNTEFTMSVKNEYIGDYEINLEAYLTNDKTIK